jgi:hypothetical protein
LLKNLKNKKIVMSLRKRRDDHQIRVALDAKAARFNLKRNEVIANLRRTQNFKVNVKK